MLTVKRENMKLDNDKQGHLIFFPLNVLSPAPALTHIKPSSLLPPSPLLLDILWSSEKIGGWVTTNRHTLQWWCSNRGSLVSHEISSCFLFLSGIEWKRKYLCITCIKASFAPQISGFIYINTMIYSILLTVGPDQNSLQAIALP